METCTDGNRKSKKLSDRLDDIHDRFLYVLEQKRIYLDAHINLVKLSQLLCTNTTYLSRTINTHFHCNLKTLLNRYRIAYAKELLKGEKCNINTLPARCGFVSRSTFYAAFFRFEHTTPIEYWTRHHDIEVDEERPIMKRTGT